MKENLFFPLSRSEIDKIGIGRTVLKHYHPKTIPRALYVLVGFTKHRKEKFDQVLRNGISVTSIGIKSSDLEKIENGDSVWAEYEDFRVIIVSDHSLRRLQEEEGR